MRFLEIFFNKQNNPDGTQASADDKKVKAKKFLMPIIFLVTGIGLLIYSRPKNNKDKQKRKPLLFVSIGSLVAGIVVGIKKLKR